LSLRRKRVAAGIVPLLIGAGSCVIFLIGSRLALPGIVHLIVFALNGLPAVAAMCVGPIGGNLASFMQVLSAFSMVYYAAMGLVCALARSRWVVIGVLLPVVLLSAFCGIIVYARLAPLL